MRSDLHVSTLNPNDLNLRPGEWWSLRCPDCDRIRLIYRLKRVTWHQKDEDDPASPECPSSRREVVIDEEPEAWLMRLYQAELEVQVLRGKPPFMPVAENPEAAAIARC